MNTDVTQPVIMWFRRDLRLTDNPALGAAVATGKPLILLYIDESPDTRLRTPGGASRWWLDKSLRQLSKDIKALGGTLTLRSGEAEAVLLDLVKTSGASGLYWNRRYQQPERDIDAGIKRFFTDKGLYVESFNANLLTEPWTIKSGQGEYYRVFSPYWRALQAQYAPPIGIPKPARLQTYSCASDNLDIWALHPTQPDWSTGFTPVWTPGETGANDRLNAFLKGPINLYKDNRNRPDINLSTSGLSPHLAFGEIGPAQIWRAVMQGVFSGAIEDAHARVFLSEIAWREFSYVLLYHNSALAEENYNAAFQHMPWRQSDEDYDRWCTGQTGFPIVDAGMRQLWQTGWMHNRVRMIVASFLTKHLLLPWQLGEAWFWDTLVDADPASNAASWQWVAGSGADAAPYFRVFNPITQGKKFDTTGEYTRTFCPELKHLPTKRLHDPWEASPVEQAAAQITLGTTYPWPMVDHKIARERALTAYESIKQKRRTR